MVMDKRNSTTGRHPVVVAILIGLFLGQMASIIYSICEIGPSSFATVIGGGAGMAYNLFGLMTSGVALYGISKQGRNKPVGKFVVGLLIEQYAIVALGLTVLVYTAHTVALPGSSFPFILLLLGVGCLWRSWDIRKELIDIQGDLQFLKKIQEFNRRRMDE